MCEQEPALAIALAKPRGLLQAAAEHCGRAEPGHPLQADRQGSRKRRSQTRPDDAWALVRSEPMLLQPELVGLVARPKSSGAVDAAPAAPAASGTSMSQRAAFAACHMIMAVCAP